MARKPKTAPMPSHDRERPCTKCAKLIGGGCSRMGRQFALVSLERGPMGNCGAAGIHWVKK